MTFEKRRLSINHWAEADRPREKMIAKGAMNLSDAELLAILIGSGTREESAVELMRRVLADCNNNLNTLGKKGIEELCCYKGLGQAKAVSILAACELGKRRKNTEGEERCRLTTSEDIYEYMLPRMQDLSHEECWVVLLNNSLRVIDAIRMTVGGWNETLVDVRPILREALLKRASLLVLSHNHPSGSVRPSRDDDRLTERVKKACDVMNIKFLDHVVVTDGAYYSYNDEGRI